MEHFNRNGEPYVDARPEHPGVLLSFVKPIHKPSGELVTRVPLRFAADRFLTWGDNLRALAIGLEDLRRIDRYGITSGSEQYLGFKALPPPGPNHVAILTVEDAERFLGSVLGGPPECSRILVDAEAYRYSYRAAAARLHPDAGGGSSEDWEKLQAAKVLLDELHKG